MHQLTSLILFKIVYHVLYAIMMYYVLQIGTGICDFLHVNTGFIIIMLQMSLAIISPNNSIPFFIVLEMTKADFLPIYDIHVVTIVIAYIHALRLFYIDLELFVHYSW
jgi:hypothetical protein